MNLCLVMIVKDEAEDIERTLLSVRDHITSWCIADTGSTDDTKAIIRRTMDGIYGLLIDLPFLDFATTRNAALTHARRNIFAPHKPAGWTLMLDGGDELVSEGPGLGSELDLCAHILSGIAAAYIDVHLGSETFQRAALLPGSVSLAYVGRTHEVVDTQDLPTGRIHRSYIEHFGAANAGRWMRDIALLAPSAPTDNRSQFYLAQSLECLGHLEAASAAYRERCNRGGWREEVYESLYRIARIAERMGKPWPDVQQLYLDAFNFSPHRAEPLRMIARHYDASVGGAARNLSDFFHGAANDIPFPISDRLFIDRSAYSAPV